MGAHIHEGRRHHHDALARAGAGAHRRATRNHAHAAMTLRALGPDDEIDLAVKDLKKGQELVDGLAVVPLVQQAV